MWYQKLRSASLSGGQSEGRIRVSPSKSNEDRDRFLQGKVLNRRTLQGIFHCFYSSSSIFSSSHAFHCPRTGLSPSKIHESNAPRSPIPVELPVRGGLCPYLYRGLGLLRLFFEQGAAQVKVAIGLLRTDSELSKCFRINLEFFQLRAGVQTCPMAAPWRSRIWIAIGLLQSANSLRIQEFAYLPRTQTILNQNVTGIKT